MSIDHRFIFDRFHQNTKMTPRQWAKRVLAILAQESMDSLDDHIQSLTQQGQEEVRAELQNLVHKLMTRQGFELESSSDRRKKVTRR